VSLTTIAKKGTVYRVETGGILLLIKNAKLLYRGGNQGNRLLKRGRFCGGQKFTNQELKEGVKTEQTTKMFQRLRKEGSGLLGEGREIGRMRWKAGNKEEGLNSKSA